MKISAKRIFYILVLVTPVFFSARAASAQVVCSDGSTGCGIVSSISEPGMWSECSVDQALVGMGTVACQSNFNSPPDHIGIQGSIPSGMIQDSSGYYNIRFYPNSSAGVTFSDNFQTLNIPQDHAGNGSVSVGNYSYNSCSTGLSCTECPGVNNASQNTTLSPGDAINVTAINQCANSPKGPYGMSAEAHASVSMGATQCFTSAYFQSIGQSRPTYTPDPTTAGKCDTSAPCVGTVIVNSIDSATGQTIGGSWTITGAATIVGQGSGSYAGKPAGSYNFTAGTPPPGYVFYSISPASSQTLSCESSISFTVMWKLKQFSSPICSPKNSSAQVGQPVNFYVNQGTAPYVWSAQSGGASPSSGSGSNFTTTFSQAGNYSVQVVDSAKNYSDCTITVTPNGGSCGPVSGSIAASPNPCTIATGQSVCTSNITWSTAGSTATQVILDYYNSSGVLIKETPFASGNSCAGTNCPAPWIGADGSYVFKLVGSAGSSCSSMTLDSVAVTGNQSGGGGSGGGGGGGSGGGGSVTVSISPGNPTVPIGKTLQFSATVTGTSDQAVEWSVACTGDLSSCGSINSTGLFTAPPTDPYAGGKTGNMSVEAVSVKDTTKSASTNVFVISGSGSSGTVIVNSIDSATGQPIGGSWTITGAATIAGQGSQGYSGEPVGSYNFTAGMPPPGYVFYSTSPASPQLLAGGSSIKFTVEWKSSGSSFPTCSAQQRTVQVDQLATFSAESGGTSPYTWLASYGGASPSSGSGSNFTTTFSQAGNYSVQIADSAGNKNACSITVTPNGGGSPPPVCSSFFANPTKIVVPESSILSWSCTHAASCDIAGSDGYASGSVNPENGNVSVTPSTLTIYTLTCTGFGSGSSNITTANTIVSIVSSSIIETNP